MSILVLCICEGGGSPFLESVLLEKCLTVVTLRSDAYIEENLKQLCRKFGAVEGVHIMGAHEHRYIFVNFRTRGDAEQVPKQKAFRHRDPTRNSPFPLHKYTQLDLSFLVAY